MNKIFFTSICIFLVIAGYSCTSDTGEQTNGGDTGGDITIITDISGKDVQGDVVVNPDASIGCKKNSDCKLGHICKDNECVEGCSSVADCPPEGFPERKLCNDKLGDNGRCVECLTNSDCKSNLCSAEGVCTEAPECSEDRDCTTPEKPYCDKSDGKCYECTEGTHCRSGSCTNHICDPFTGCDRDQDCKDSKLPHCDTKDNKCYE
ncbi:MAG: hypothetical protein N3B13_07175, partial [Deltaproteobacteria bacterium]|nr:hypothetical protein [Deltaproteobacteria bacterium]